MAKVKGPLLSLTASGALGNAIAYHNRLNTATVKKLTEPPQSIAARKNPVRTIYSQGRAAYNALDKDQKKLYVFAASLENNLTSYTFFMRQYIKEKYSVAIKKVILTVDLQGANTARCAEAIAKTIFLSPGTETILYTQYAALTKKTSPDVFLGASYDIPAGTYDLRILAGAYLARKITNVVVPAGIDTVDVNFTSGNGKHLLLGDVAWSGSINMLDQFRFAHNMGKNDE